MASGEVSGNESRLGRHGHGQEDEPDDDQTIDGRRLRGRIDEDAQDLWIGQLETDGCQDQTRQHQRASPLRT